MECVSGFREFTDCINLYPIGDVHKGARACDWRAFLDWRQRILDDPQGLAIGNGDYVDAIIVGDKRFRGSSLDPDLFPALEEILNRQRDMVVDMFKPLSDAGKLLGLGVGNHEDKVCESYGFDILKDACGVLRVPYLGYSCFYRLTIKKKGANTKRNVIIYQHHGPGGSSKKKGTSLNKLQDHINYWDCDIMIFGHDHQTTSGKAVRLGVTSNGEPKLVAKPIAMLRNGSFLKTVNIGTTAYSEKSGYPPVIVGEPPYCRISFKGHDKNLDIRVIE